MREFGLVMMMIMACSLTNAQGQELSPTDDGAFKRGTKQNRAAIRYIYQREADVMWSKHIWRTIDLREKFNHPLYYPLEPRVNYQSLFDVILTGIDEGTITAYDAIDDQFRYPISKKDVFSMLSDTTYEIDDGLIEGELDTLEIVEEITAGDIRRYEIKEEWFFDKQRSVLDVRIIGIAPQAVKKDEYGNEIGRRALFWVFFPEARHVFARQAVFNGFNDGARMSFDDLFWKRMFHSYIHKESNVYDRALYDYKSGIAFQLEADRIKEDLRNFESDLWEY